MKACINLNGVDISCHVLTSVPRASEFLVVEGEEGHIHYLVKQVLHHIGHNKAQYVTLVVSVAE